VPLRVIAFCQQDGDVEREILPTDDAAWDRRAAARPATIGERVRVRRESWVVSDLRQFDRCALLSLEGAGVTNAGADLQVLTPYDQVEPIAVRSRLRRVSGRRWRHACRSLIAAAGGAGDLHAARAAAVKLMPFQLAPALAIVRGLGSRVLIADEVGLGKTIQAGLILNELIARGAATRILVLTPSGLREQWTEELKGRFGLEPVLVDMIETRQRQGQLPVGANPWTATPLAITSIDYVKRPDVLLAVHACHWDVVVIDEAHGIGVGTDRERAAAALCVRAAYVILLTGTPHNGDSRAFHALCSLGEGGDPLLTFRRTRAEAGLGIRRRIHRVHVRPHPDERRMHAALAAFARAIRRQRPDANGEIALALAVLQKRAFSSAHALAHSVQRRLAALDDPASAGVQQLLLPLDDPAGELDAADDAPAWTLPALEDPRQERTLLIRIADAARDASRHDTKLGALRRLLDRIHEPVIVFTEFRDTLFHIRDRVAPDASAIHGGLSRTDRRLALDRFSHSRLLLATDAAGEGLNLHARCRVVVNFELPWNPVRLEQRLGRVDRIGQTRTVHAFHLIAAAAGETRMLERLQARLRRADIEIGTANPLESWTPPVDQDTGWAVPELRELANAEHERVAMARRMVDGRVLPQRDASDALVTRTRRSRTRTKLRSRALVICESTLADSLGRVVGSRLTAFFIPSSTASFWTRPELDAFAAAVDERERPIGLDESIAHHRRFWECRLARESVVAEQLRRVPRVSLQPGLFDHRAIAAHGLAAVESSEQAAALAARIASAERALCLTEHRLRPMLLLIP